MRYENGSFEGRQGVIRESVFEEFLLHWDSQKLFENGGSKRLRMMVCMNLHV